MDGFRVIRDFADFTNSQYGYSTAGQGQQDSSVRAGTAPWHAASAAGLVGGHAFKNPYEDFGTSTGSIGPIYAGGGRSGDGGNQKERGSRGNSGGGGKFQRQQLNPQNRGKKINRRREHIQYPVFSLFNTFNNQSI
jgi:hypothetical protein